MPTTLKLTEPVIDAILAKLKTGVGARVAAINQETTTDQITVVAPTVDAYYVGGLPGIPPQAACVVVTELGADYEAEGQHSFVMVAEILVWIQDVDSDRSVLSRKLLRLARAVTETLWDDEPREQLSDGAFHIRPVRRVPGPVFSPEDGRSMWTGHLGIVFRCRAFAG